MPGLTFKVDGLELGIGDFIVFSALAGYSARRAAASLFIAYTGVLVGLVPIMLHLALARRRTVVPALPLSVAIGCALLALEGYLLRPLSVSLAGLAIHL